MSASPTFEDRYNALAERLDLGATTWTSSPGSPRTPPTPRSPLPPLAAYHRRRCLSLTQRDSPSTVVSTRVDVSVLPELAQISVRYRGSFVYVTGTTREDEVLPLCRLRYLGSPKESGFAAYVASEDGYEHSFLRRGSFTGTPRRSHRLRLRPLPERHHGVD
ncbi:MAG TPA: hypothetical protein VK988_22055 [Acidimicrobiales bacterium]|nr:hypothetical protein [Acidimicrobiales bacterium]